VLIRKYPAPSACVLTTFAFPVGTVSRQVSGSLVINRTIEGRRLLHDGTVMRFAFERDLKRATSICDPATHSLGATMNLGKLVFAQVTQHLPLTTFRRCDTRDDGEHKVKSFSCLEQFLCVAFAQLTYRESLRDIEACMRAQVGKQNPPHGHQEPSFA